MNKGIQQARTLTDKYLANKDKADQKTEATQRDVSQKVVVQAQPQEKPRPVLQQKQSSGGKASKQSSNLLGLINPGGANNGNENNVTVNPSTNEAAALIRDTIQAHLNDTGMRFGSNALQIKSVNGKYFAVWQESNSNSVINAIKAQLFDSYGKAAGEASIITPGGLSSTCINDLTVYDNNRVAITWSGSISGTNGSTSSLNVNILDSSGKMLTSERLGSATSSDAGMVNLNKAVSLGNGSLALLWNVSKYNMSTMTSDSTLKVQIYDSYGMRRYQNPTSLVGGLSNVNVGAVSQFNNGNIAVLLNEQSSFSTPMYNELLVLDSQGNALTGRISIGRGGSIYSSNIVSTSNGNLAVIYTDGDSNSQSLKAQIFNSQGVKQLTSPVSISSSAKSAGINKVISLADGRLALFWNENGWGTDVYLKSAIFDPASKTTTQQRTLTGAGITWAYIDKYATFADGKTAVFWREERALGGGSYNEYVKGQVFDSRGNTNGSFSLLTSGMKSGYVSNTITLADGRLAVFWSETTYSSTSTLKVQIFNTNGAAIFGQAATIGGSGAAMMDVRDIATFANGDMAVFWAESYGNIMNNASVYRSLSYKMFDSSGRVLSAAALATGLDGVSIGNITTLANGDKAVFWNQTDKSNNKSIKLQVFRQGSSGGQVLSSPIIISNKGIPSLDNVTVLDDGKLSIFYREQDSMGNISYKTQVLNAKGSFEVTGPLRLSETGRDISNIADKPIIDFGKNAMREWDVNPSMLDYSYTRPSALMSTAGFQLSIIFRELVLNDNALHSAGQTSIDAVKKAVDISFGQSALQPVGMNMTGQEMEIAMRLADIMKNPSDDQKVVLDVIKALLADTAKTQGEQGGQATAELAKAQDGLLQAVANILLAQGVPDLLKSGDVSNVKAIFSELDAQKNKIMIEYEKSTKPYYENIIKDMAKNMSILQLKNLLNVSMTKEELSKLPPSELDKILEKIKNMKDRSFEEEYLLQQEQKYRKDYIDPSKKKLEGDMKGMLKSFTERLNDVLKTTDKK